MTVRTWLCDLFQSKPAPVKPVIPPSPRQIKWLFQPESFEIMRHGVVVWSGTKEEFLDLVFGALS